MKGNISTPIRAAVNRPNWWLRLTSSGWAIPAVTAQHRELRRRSTLASWIILGLLVGLAIVSPLVAVDTPSRIGIGVLLVTALAAAFLNRNGFVTATGILLTIVMILAPLSAITPEVGRPGGGLDLDALPVYDLLALAVLFASSLLTPVAGFWVAGVNILLMILDFTLQPHDTYLRSEMLHLYGGAVSGTIILLVRPAGLQTVVAVMVFLLVRGIRQASVRADLAEFEKAEAKRQAEYEERQRAEINGFVEQVLAAHYALANNQPPTEVCFPKGHPFAQAATFLNDQLLKTHLRKQERRLEDPLLVPAINRLREAMARAAAAPPGAQDWYDLLHPRTFSTNAPVIDEIAQLIYHTLYVQVDYAFKHKPISKV